MNTANDNNAPVVDQIRRAIFSLLANVPDPEIPVLSILDLGIVRDVKINDNEIVVCITPTYSGCPAMDMIGKNILIELRNGGYKNVSVKYQLSPAWTSDWLTDEGKEKLKAYGIAPPAAKSGDKTVGKDTAVQCPHCRSNSTELISQFGSTACKALYRCRDCGEPFDHFKCH